MKQRDLTVTIQIPGKILPDTRFPYKAFKRCCNSYAKRVALKQNTKHLILIPTRSGRGCEFYIPHSHMHTGMVIRMDKNVMKQHSTLNIYTFTLLADLYLVYLLMLGNLL